MPNTLGHSNSGGGSYHPAEPLAVPPAGEIEVEVVLDQAANIRVRLSVQHVDGESVVMLAIHDPKRSGQPGEAEAYAVLVAPGPMGELGAAASRMARVARRGRRQATEPGS